MSMRRKALGAISFICLGMTTIACGQREVVNPTSGNSMTGVVKYGTEQLQFALVIVDQGLSTSIGVIRDDGTYFVDNVQVGEAIIAVNTDASRGQFIAKTMQAGAMGAEGKTKKKVDLKFIEVPKNYHEPTTSTLKTTLVKGENAFDIVIHK